MIDYKLSSGSHEFREAGMCASFWAKVDRGTDGECWPWTAHIMHRGYGLFTFGKTVRAHRVAYELAKGPIPDGLVIDHLCGNRACCNPGHLEAVTQAENLRRSVLAPSTVNATKTRCPKGHQYDQGNTRLRDGKRECRACGRERERERRARLRAQEVTC